MRIYKRGLINQKLIDQIQTNKSIDQLNEAVESWRYEGRQSRQNFILKAIAWGCILFSITVLFLSCTTPSEIANRKFYKAHNIHPQTTFNNCATIAPPVASIKTYSKTGIIKSIPNSVIINCDTVRDGVFYPVPVTVTCPPSTERVDTFYNEKIIVNKAKEVSQALRIEDLIKQSTKHQTQSKFWRSTAIISIFILIIVFMLKSIL